MMDANTGKKIDEIDHINQSIERILTTPVGTRVMRRSYGSVIPELIDQPLTSATVLRIISASASAIARWEKRVALNSMRLVIQDKKVICQIEFTHKNERQTLRVKVSR